MNLYRVEMKVRATAYIKAESEDEAIEKMKSLRAGFGVEEDDFISGEEYDDPDLPDISSSPLMAIHDVFDEVEEYIIDLVEKNIDKRD